MRTSLSSLLFGICVMCAAIDIVEAQKSCRVYLFISKEFYRRLWGNFNHIGAIPSPQRFHTSFLYHHGKTRWYSYPVLTWCLHLHETTDSITQQREWQFFHSFLLTANTAEKMLHVHRWEGFKSEKYPILTISIICQAGWRLLRAKNGEFGGLKCVLARWNKPMKTENKKNVRWKQPIKIKKPSLCPWHFPAALRSYIFQTFLLLFSVFLLSMPSKVIIILIVTEFVFLGIILCYGTLSVNSI